MLYNEFNINRFEYDGNLDVCTILETYVNKIELVKHFSYELNVFNIDFINDTNVQTIANIININNEIDLLKLFKSKTHKDISLYYVKKHLTYLCLLSNNQSILEKLYHLSSLINDEDLSNEMLIHLLLNVNIGRNILKNIDVDENNVILFAFRKLDSYLFNRINNYELIKNNLDFFVKFNNILNDLKMSKKIFNNSYYEDIEYDDDISSDSLNNELDEYLLSYGFDVNKNESKKIICEHCNNLVSLKECMFYDNHYLSTGNFKFNYIYTNVSNWECVNCGCLLKDKKD